MLHTLTRAPRRFALLLAPILALGMLNAGCYRDHDHDDDHGWNDHDHPDQDHHDDQADQHHDDHPAQHPDDQNHSDYQH